MSMPSSSDEVAISAFELAGLQPRFRAEAVLLREAAVVAGDVLRADPLGEEARRALGEAPVVDEDERRPVREDQLGEPRRTARPRLRSP